MWQQLKNIYHYITALAANIYYGFPARKLTVIGITGTSGKTTTTYMTYEVLQAAGYKVSMLSTIKAAIGGKDLDTGFHVTTPDPHALPKYLRQAVDNGDTHFVLEISSHALDQNRAAFVHFTIGVLTTLAHEHLDYHKTMANYARAKFKLLHQADKVVLPVHGIDEKLKPAVSYDAVAKRAITFGINEGDENQKDWQLDLQMPGEFNLKDALAAATVAKLLGVKKDVIKKALSHITSLPGRFEEIANDRGFRIIIDFAHKPDALEGVLSVAQKEVKKPGRVIVLFGSASQRDVLKRPIMGEIAGRLADITVLTDEDPRFEDPMKIIDEIAAGCKKAGAKEKHESSKNQENNEHVYYKISDRKTAIDFIINTVAKPGDIVLLCGKGHETSMNYNGVEKPWSEQQAVQDALTNDN